MWNSNSIVSWLIVSSGLDVELASMPSGGRAPGWIRVSPWRGGRSNKRIEQNATRSALNRQVSRVCSCAVR